MCFFGVRLILMLSVFQLFLFAAGQASSRYSGSMDEFNYQIFEFDFYQTVTVEKENSIKLNDLNSESVAGSEYLGIIHAPSQDFNIYLSIHNSAESDIQLSLDLSLNDAGVMNLRSRILLRKKKGNQFLKLRL